MRAKFSIEDITEFWAKVKKGEPDECWPWQGATSHGYGEICFDYVKEKAHRVAWVLTNGRLLSAQIIMHSCDNTGCCNPNHLINGTPALNSQDMVNKHRSKKGMKHWASKLTDNQVREIRKATGPQSFIAYDYGISQSKVSLIKTRKAWSHVPDEE